MVMKSCLRRTSSYSTLAVYGVTTAICISDGTWTKWLITKAKLL